LKKDGRSVSGFTHEVRAVVDDALRAAITVQGADFGNVQLYRPESGTLEIAAQRGFGREFLDFFAQVSDGFAACGEAMQKRRRIIVRAVASDPIFAGSEAQQIVLAAGVRAVQSTPVISAGGRFFGVLSTHFRNPGMLFEPDLLHVDALVAELADSLGRLRYSV
jgi:GAF domain-containing protein